MSVADGEVVADHDVLLIGGGLAGLRAAIAIAESGPTLDIALASKVYPMRSHTVSAEGGAAGVIAADDSLDEHAYDTISGGDWLGDQDAVEAFVSEAPRELLQLEHWGCPWSREPDGTIAVRPFGGMKKMRTWFAADKTGFHMLHTLFQTSLQVRADPCATTSGSSTKLLVEDGPRAGRGRDRADAPDGSRRITAQGGDPVPPAAAGASSRSPPTPTSRPATAWRWPTARACRSRTWSSCSTTRPGCRSPAS